MASSWCSFTEEASFGPSVSPCRRQFDFTLFFEECFFLLLPSCVFILAAVARMGILLRRPAKVGWGRLHAIKLGALATFLALQLAILICISAKSKNERTGISIPAAVLCFLASLQLALLSHFEHVRSYRPSFLIAIYLAVTLLLRIATLRTYRFVHGSRSPDFALPLASILIQTGIIVLEHCSKRQCFLPGPQKVSPEEAAGFWSRSAFAWLNRLLVIGYRRPLQCDDLRIVDPALSSSRMADEFSRLQTSKDYGSLGLLGMTYRCLGLYALAPILPRLCVTGFTFCQPFLASALISHLEDPNPSKNNGYGLIGASLLVYVGMTISQAFYLQLCWKGTTKIRGGLVEVINAKMLRLKYEKGVESKVVTLIIGDTWRIMVGLAFIHDLWAPILEIAIGTWLLWRQVGPASLAVLAVAIVSLVISLLIGQSIGKQQSGWLAATEKRLEATKALLSSLKAIKMMASSPRIKSSIEKLRLLEFGASKMYRILMVGSVFCSFTTVTLAPVVVFGAYIGWVNNTNQENGTFDTARMFSSLILIALVANPLINAFQVIPNLGAAVGCARRVEEFLRKEEISDTRSNLSEDTDSGNGTVNVSLRNDGGENLTGHGPLVLSLRQAEISWDEKDLLKDINLKVRKGQHIVITGPVGSGKSLLLQAILGEVAPKAGDIRLKHGISIAYCTQTVWLENLSARDNAFRGAPDDNVWRERVIDACALQELVGPEFAGTTIGSGGSKISGGEKQRLSLARAMASRPSLLLLDDVFSALDRSTKQIIFDRLFGPEGIVTEQRITVIQVTQDRHVAELADAVYKIDKDGHLAPYQFPTSNDIGDSENANGDPLKDKAQDDTSGPPSDEEEKVEENEATSCAGGKKEHGDPASVGDREVYRVYFRTIGPTHMGIFVLGCMAFAVTWKFPDIWVKWWTSDAAREQQTRSTEYWIGLYAFLGGLPLVVAVAALSHLMLKIITRSGVGLHGKLLKTVINSTFVFVSGIDSGSIMNRFNQDLMLVDFRLPLDLFNTFSSGCNVAVQLVLVAIAAIYALAALPFILLVIYVIQHFYLRTSKRLRQLDLETKSDLHTKVSESYQGLATIRAHRWQRRVLEEFWEKLDRSQEPQYLLWMVQTWLSFVLNMIVTGLAVIITGIAVSVPSKTSAGALGLAFVNITTLGEYMANTVLSWTSLETSLGAIARIEAFEKDTPVEKEITDPIEVPSGWPKAGALSFDHLWASYHPEHEKPSWSLQDVTLEIEPGEKIAVCGRSGSGKSTLLMALLGLVETPRGSISLDGINISRVPREVLRSKYFVISQDNFLGLGESIREILDPDGNYTGGEGDQDIRVVLGECGVLDKVMSECGGLEGSLKDVTLSVGEAQLFALARAILHAGAPGKGGGVVLFDEATSSIDTATEEKIMKLVAEKLKGKTMVSVLHRLETALEYDRIMVLEKGQVACFGAPEQVLHESELFSSLRKR